MSLTHNISTCPIPHDLSRGEEAGALFSDLPEPFRNLIKGTAGSSAYLASSIQKESEWLKENAPNDPKATLENLLEPLKSIPLGQLPEALRVTKRRAALLIALADLGGLWSLSEVTRALSDLADASVQVSLSALVKKEFDAGKLPMCSPEDLQADCGMSILGMGKHGARELNYSSDIDLIVFFDESRFEPDDYAHVRGVFVRVTKGLVKMLSEMTGDGYVFRTDLRLRPDPSVTPVCIAFEAAEHYYESLGRTWERAAMIKARPVAGDLKAGAAFIKRLRPFIWRRHLDFAAIKDAEDMLLKIRSHKGLSHDFEFSGHDLKLGRGGIREIEFFAQTRQLIFAGRLETLRSRETVQTLRDLAEEEQITSEISQTLQEAYVEHRTLEHRIQMMDDAQTHLIPTSKEKQTQLANLCGFQTAHDLAKITLSRLAKVHKSTELRRDNGEGEPTQEIPDELENRFEAREENWFQMSALRNTQARDVYARLRPVLMEKFARLQDPDTVLLRFEQFISGLPSGVQVFSLFENTPTLLELVIDICAVSPALAEYLGRNRSVLDSVLDRDFFEAFPAQEDLQNHVDHLLKEAGDYEQVLDALRRWQKEIHFRNGVHQLRAIASPKEAAETYSMIADVSIRALMPHVEQHLARRFGPAPGRGVAILAMGKLGSRDMTATSDLDLIAIYDGDGVLETSGPKEISTGMYYAKFTQALIGALTVPTSEGSLYEVDMRLRPSGKTGPVATSLSAFATYQMKDAWTWEHLALTRARLIDEDDPLGRDVRAAITQTLSQKRDPDKTFNDVNEMRQKLSETFNDTKLSSWETKRGGGHLLDIELCTQCGILLNSHAADFSISGRAADDINTLLDLGWFEPQDARVLLETHKTLSSLQQLERLIGPSFNPSEGDQRILGLLKEITGQDRPKDAQTRISELTTQAKSVIDRRLQSGRSPDALTP